MKKKLLIVLVALAVIAGLGFLGYKKLFAERRVNTKALVTAFASAPAEVKGQVDQAVVAIKSADWLASLKTLKEVADKGGLSQEQKDVLGRTCSDISGMKPGANAAAVEELILEIQTKLAE